jgi:hypothetical protein
MVFVVPSGLASAAPVAASDSSGSASWAYGGLSTISFSGTSSAGVPYVGNATYGFSVLITQTNSTVLPHHFELTVGRTMGASFAVKYCLPNCHKPTYFAGLSARVWETINSTAFLIDNGTVNEPAGPVTAFALQNASTVQVDNVSESTSSYLPAASGAGGVSRAGYLGVQLRTTGSVAFATPLGLFPTNLSTAQSWNSTAAFQASLDSAYSYFASWAGPLVHGTGQGNGTIPVQSDGTLNLSGSYAPADTIALGGAHFAEVALSIQGPFTLRDGLLLVPVASDLFQGSSEPWSGNESGIATASPSFVDLRSASAAGHFGLGASRWLYDSQTLEPTAVAPASSNGVTDLAGAGTPDAAPATVVQGQPESVAQAQSTQGCLVSGACPSGGGPSPFRGLVGLVAVGGVAAAALIVAVVVVERRRMPPPTYPNAALYPPGANGAPRTGPTGPTPPPPSPPDEDPLGNLW